MFKLGNRSLQRLEGVHPDLVKVVEKAIELTSIDFTVLEGVRDIERQRELVRTGASQTLDSRHLTGHAVDIAPWVGGKVSWHWPHYFPMADSMLRACRELDIPLRWGGNWRVHDLRKWYGSSELLNSKYKGRFPDGPHFELTRKFYP